MYLIDRVEPSCSLSVDGERERERGEEGVRVVDVKLQVLQNRVTIYCTEVKLAVIK